MAQITWRTVLGESLANVARPFEMARQSFNDGFGALNRVLDQRNAGEAEMAKQTQDTNQANYADLVSTIARPEDAVALAPQLQAQRALLSPAARAATRDAVDNRTGAVMKQITDRRNFALDEQKAAETPLRTEIGMLALKDPKAAMALLEANPNMLGRDVAMKAIVDGDRDGQKWTAWVGDRAHTEKKQAHETQMMPLDIRAKEASINASDASAYAARVNADNSSQVSRAQLGAMKLEAEARKRADEAARGLSLSDQGYMNTGTGFQKFSDAMDKLKITPSARKDIMHNLDQSFRDGINIGTKEKPEYVPVPVSLAVKALQASEENWFANIIPGWSRQGDNLSSVLKSYLESPQIVEELRRSRNSDLERTIRDAAKKVP
jgi:hypothetical protein